MTNTISNVVVPAEDGRRVLARDSYGSISLYSPDRNPADLDLSDNTNLWGAPPATVSAVASSATSALTRYPSLYATDLKRAIADYVGVSPDMIVTGCGSDDVLDSTIRAFGEPGNILAYPDPSFAMIPIFARMNGLVGQRIPLTRTNDLDAGRYASCDARINYVCSPNNPTGASFSRDAIERIVRDTTGLVVIDEAYAEFASRNCLGLLKLSARVVVARTLSKAFGLAGLRVGYAIGDAALVAEIEKSRGPYKISGLAERAALAALGDGRSWVEEHVRRAVVNRARFIESLVAIGFAPLPSESNFVLVPVADSEGWDARLRAQGIAVRPFRSLPRIGDALRISIGPWDMMERCLAAIRKIRQ